jgi:hypothetical protein
VTLLKGYYNYLNLPFLFLFPSSICMINVFTSYFSWFSSICNSMFFFSSHPNIGERFNASCKHPKWPTDFFGWFGCLQDGKRQPSDSFQMAGQWILLGPFGCLQDLKRLTPSGSRTYINGWLVNVQSGRLVWVGMAYVVGPTTKIFN